MHRYYMTAMVVLVLMARLEPAVAEDKPTMAVMDFASSQEVPQDLISYLYSRIQAELVSRGKFDVMGTEPRNRALREEGSMQAGAVSQASAANIGKLLGVEKVLFGSVNQVFGGYVLTLNLLDVKTTKIEKSAEEAFKESLSSVKAAAMRVVKQITGVTASPLSRETVPSQSEEETDMVYIPAGAFTMGAEGRFDDEKPVHKVYLDAYYMDRYEVTNAQYGAFMKATGRAAPEFWNDSRFNHPDRPVVGVTWYDGEAYCKWVGKRLPTEAEWEKAARGTDARIYPWGNSFGSGRANLSDRGDRYEYTAPVGSFPSGASPYGVHDMAGNVWEWVNDWHDKGYYSRSPGRNPTGPDAGKYKVLRGGSWYDDPRFLRTAYRRGNYPGHQYDLDGFRCSKTLK